MSIGGRSVSLRKFIQVAEVLCRIGVGVAFAVLIAAVVIQVVGRSVIGNSPVWTEELTRFALLFLAAFGAGLSYRSGDLVNVDVICDALPGRIPWLLRLLSAVATAALCIVLIRPAWTFMSIGGLQTSPALGWRMDFVLVSVLLMVVSLALFATARIAEMLTTPSDGALPNDRES